MWSASFWGRRHNLSYACYDISKAIVMEQATVTQAIPIITSAQLAAYEAEPTIPQQSSNEHDGRRGQVHQQQQEGREPC